MIPAFKVNGASRERGDMSKRRVRLLLALGLAAAAAPAIAATTEIK